jgi:hypothetical protein
LLLVLSLLFPACLLHAHGTGNDEQRQQQQQPQRRHWGN